jgi:hypothetical protein
MRRQGHGSAERREQIGNFPLEWGTALGYASIEKCTASVESNAVSGTEHRQKWKFTPEVGQLRRVVPALRYRDLVVRE